MDQQPRRRRIRPTADETAAQQPRIESRPDETPAPKPRELPEGGQRRRRRANAGEEAAQPVSQITAPQAIERYPQTAEQQPALPQQPALDTDAVFLDDTDTAFDEQEISRRRVNDGPNDQKTPGVLSRLDAIVCRIGDACIAGIKGILVLLAMLLTFAAAGVKKLLSRLNAGKRSLPEDGHPHDAPQEEFTLEPTRPEDCRGFGEKRSRHGLHAHLPHCGVDANAADPAAAASQNEKPKKPVSGAHKKKADWGYRLTMIALSGVMVVSLFMIGSIVHRSISTKRLNQTLSERYNQLTAQTATTEPETDEPILTPAPTATPEPTPTPQATAAVRTTIAPTAKPVVQSTKFHQVGGDPLPEMEALYQENRDLVGWLEMEGILSLPVMYKDNSYYLKRDFYKNKNDSGTLFLDVNHPFRENAQNLLLHGHNMRDGTMFGRLVQYETNTSFLKNNPFVNYSTLWKKERYVIFAVLHVSLDVTNEEFFNYFTHHTFTSDAQFDQYIRSLQTRSVYAIPIDVQPSDALLTMSTCLEDDRLVIVARRVREGENKSELRRLVQLAAKQ